MTQQHQRAPYRGNQEFPPPRYFLYQQLSYLLIYLFIYLFVGQIIWNSASIPSPSPSPTTTTTNIQTDHCRVYQRVNDVSVCYYIFQRRKNPLGFSNNL